MLLLIKRKTTPERVELTPLKYQEKLNNLISLKYILH